MNKRQYELLYELKEAIGMVEFYQRNAKGDKNVGWKLRKWESKVCKVCAAINRAK